MATPRKSVMVDTQTGNRLETYQHNAYLRSMGEAVADLLDLSESKKYYAGIHFDGNDYRVISFGKSDDEAARNLAKKVDGLTPWDVKRYEDVHPGEKVYFTIECTKKLYDIQEFTTEVHVDISVDGYADCITHGLNLLEIDYNLFKIKFDEDTNGKYADLEDAYYALLSDDGVYYVSTGIREIVENVPKFFDNFVSEYSEEEQEAYYSHREDDDDEICAGLLVEMDRYIKIAENFRIRRCTRQLYLDALAADCGAGECCFYNSVLPSAESVAKDVLEAPREGDYGYFSCVLLKAEENSAQVISVGKSVSEALLYNNAKEYALSKDKVKEDGFDHFLYGKCTRELYAKFLLSEWYDDHTKEPVYCRIDLSKSEDSNASIFPAEIFPAEKGEPCIDLDEKKKEE